MEAACIDQCAVMITASQQSWGPHGWGAWLTPALWQSDSGSSSSTTSIFPNTSQKWKVPMLDFQGLFPKLYCKARLEPKGPSLWRKSPLLISASALLLTARLNFIIWRMSLADLLLSPNSNRRQEKLSKVAFEEHFSGVTRWADASMTLLRLSCVWTDACL